MKAVAVLSGGLDSTVSLAIARAKGIRVVVGLFFDYGQKAAPRERFASRAVCRFYRIPWKSIRLPWLAEITRTALVGTRSVPRVRETDLSGARARETARAVWVPNRNGVFLNIAAAHAESMGADLVLTGFDREEAETFPDNSRAYLDAANRALRYSTANGVRVRSFVAGLDKAQIVRRGLRLRAPLDVVWSCYLGGIAPCGRCESCVRSARAWRKNGVP